jgi:hypothetical protein
MLHQKNMAFIKFSLINCLTIRRNQSEMNEKIQIEISISNSIFNFFPFSLLQFIHINFQ